ncbi:histidine kinase [Marinicrinis sediminis]|uniref:histidine kinase n=1 Tax=Marinicrinis sediminis TaxID=1652465 RepID=A0ABW5R7Q6_9BACL
MQTWSQKLRKHTGLSPYVWVVFYILPFYFIFHSASAITIASGIIMITAFFVAYVLSFISKGWTIYLWTSVQIAISTAMGLLFGYVYFSLFLAFLIGNLKNKTVFFTLYFIHLTSTAFTINYGFATDNSVIITQLPFVFLSLIAVILLPVSTYNKNKEEKLQGQLEDANKRISELVKLEERQRIARDLHDTLGHKLSLIGLKSDLAGKLIDKNASQARQELADIQWTARTALKEVREIVTQMRGVKLENALQNVEQMLNAANIEWEIEGDPRLEHTSLIAENVLSMALKEAVTNVVKHSKATTCSIMIQSSSTELLLEVKDNGVGIADPVEQSRGNGLRGMKERLEFVNGSLGIISEKGTRIHIRVPNTVRQVGAEGKP